MKKINYYLFYALLFTQCIDPSVDRVFDQGQNQRVEDLREKYTQALTAPKHGWITEYAITHGDYLNDKFRVGAYTLLLKFNRKGRVVVKSDYRQGAVDDVINYRIDRGWKMELVFENYTVFHAIAIINGFQVKGGFVFNIKIGEAGEVTLSSRLRRAGFAFQAADQTHLHLHPAEAKDWDLTPILAMEKRIPQQGSITTDPPISFEYKPKRSFNFNYALSYPDGGSSRRVMALAVSKDFTLNAPLWVSDEGFGFVRPVELPKLTLSEFTYDADRSLFYETKNNEIKIFF